MEEVARYECVYHRNSKNSKDKNKKANCWDNRSLIKGPKTKLRNETVFNTCYIY